MKILKAKIDNLHKVLIVTLVITIALLIHAWYNHLVSSLAKSWEVEKRYIVNEDLLELLKVLKESSVNINDFLNVPDSLRSFRVDSETRHVSFQIVNVNFDEDGNLMLIK